MNYMLTPGIKEPKIGYRDIVNIVCNYYNLKKEDVISRNRFRKYVIPRQFIHYFLRDKTDLSYQKIGSISGHDHSTAIYSVKMINDLMMYDEFKVIESKINNLITEHINKREELLQRLN